MTLIWLIQENMRNQTARNQMCGALDKIDVPYELIPLVPFVDEIPFIASLENGIKTICWGPGFVPRTRLHPNFSPGIWYDETTFRWSSFKTQWGDLLFSQDAAVTAFRGAVENLSDTDVFIRPDGDTKAFDGGVYSMSRPPKLSANFDEDIAVVVAPVQRVVNEWRFFIVGKQIVSASSYRVLGKPSIAGLVPEDATDLVKRALDLWQPADVFCLDVGFTGQQYGIVEANCFNASRVYGADVLQIVDAVSQWSINGSL